MRIAFISGGAAGMYCGSCIHDNLMASTLQDLGHDAALIPLYTPLRTDDESASIDRVFYGAVNTYLDVKSSWIRRLPLGLRRFLDRPGLLRKVGEMGSAADAKELGELTLAVLQGDEGPTRAELEQLAEWLAKDLRPQVVHLQNSLFVGLARRIRELLGVPVISSLQGEDLFLDELIEPYRSQAIALIQRRSADLQGFTANSEYYADHMAQLLGLDRSLISVVPLGLNLEGLDVAPTAEEGSGQSAAAAVATATAVNGSNSGAADDVFTVGYFARLCPEKGLGVALEGFADLAQRVGPEAVRFRAAGYLAPKDAPWLRQQIEKISEQGLGERVEIVGEVDRQGKIDALRSFDVLTVPTVYREPKGLFALEAMACGVPVVLAEHGTFPEMVEETGGGVLVAPESPAAVADAVERLFHDPQQRWFLGKAGHAGVRRRHGARRAAESLLAVYDQRGAVAS
ncbi:MAG: glycosyltransferase family 4 protein [Acidobacteriota bacterium]